MTQSYDVVAIGNAIVDVIAQADDALVADEGLTKGGMRLVDADQATRLYAKMGVGREMSGGSAANTLAGMAALGCRSAFIGQVAEDQLGDVFRHDMNAGGVRYDIPSRPGEPPTGRCLILVTPDGERTMNTFLGAAHYLPREAVTQDAIADARLLYLEGYMWDPPEPREAILRAIAFAREAGRKIALTLSVTFFIEQYRADFLRLVDDGLIDILFCNEEEAGCLLETSDYEQAIDDLAARVPLLVVTHGAQGATAVENGVRTRVPAEPVAKVVDTTGAGDLFAAGFLAGQLQGRSLADSLTMGAVCAAECIGHYGPRPEGDLKALVEARLG